VPEDARGRIWQPYCRLASGRGVGRGRRRHRTRGRA
jgi:hypothetical protein